MKYIQNKKGQKCPKNYPLGGFGSSFPYVFLSLNFQSLQWIKTSHHWLDAISLALSKACLWVFRLSVVLEFHSQRTHRWSQRRTTCWFAMCKYNKNVKVRYFYISKNNHLKKTIDINIVSLRKYQVIGLEMVWVPCIQPFFCYA